MDTQWEFTLNLIGVNGSDVPGEDGSSSFHGGACGDVPWAECFHSLALTVWRLQS